MASGSDRVIDLRIVADRVLEDPEVSEMVTRELANPG